MKKRIIPFLFILLAAAFFSCSDGTTGSGPGGGQVSDMGLPPDPGEPGKATIEGIDSDNDGVRDDIQRYIALTYPDAPTRNALRQYAKAQQSMLVSTDNKEQAVNAFSELGRSMECLYSIHSNEAKQISDRVESVIANTEGRVRAYIQASEHLGGETFPVVGIDERANSCR